MLLPRSVLTKIAVACAAPQYLVLRGGRSFPLSGSRTGAHTPRCVGGREGASLHHCLPRGGVDALHVGQGRVLR